MVTKNFAELQLLIYSCHSIELHQNCSLVQVPSCRENLVLGGLLRRQDKTGSLSQECNYPPCMMHWVWKPDSGRWHMLSALLSCCHGAQFCILGVMRTLGVRRPPWLWRSKGDLGVVLNFSFISCTVLSSHLFLPIQLVCGVHHSIHNVLGDYKTAANIHRKL